MGELEGLYTVKEASEMVGCSKSFIHKMIQEGQIIPIRKGVIMLVSARDIERARERYEKYQEGRG